MGSSDVQWPRQKGEVFLGGVTPGVIEGLVLLLYLIIQELIQLMLILLVSYPMSETVSGVFCRHSCLDQNMLCLWKACGLVAVSFLATSGSTLQNLFLSFFQWKQGATMKAFVMPISVNWLRKNIHLFILSISLLLTRYIRNSLFQLRI